MNSRLRTSTSTAAATTTLLGAAVVAALALSACGSDEAGAPDEPRPIPDDIVLDDAPEPLFGSSSGASQAEVDPSAGDDGERAPVSTVNPCPPDVDPMDPVCQGIPDVVMPDDVEAFVPASDDAAFCDTLADIDTRPRPSDDFDELRVTQIWLDELRVVSPDPIVEEFDLLIDFVDTAVDAGANAVDDIEIAPELDDAVETISAYVETNCLGF